MFVASKNFRQLKNNLNIRKINSFVRKCEELVKGLHFNRTFGLIQNVLDIKNFFSKVTGFLQRSLKFVIEKSKVKIKSLFFFVRLKRSVILFFFCFFNLLVFWL